MCICILVYVSNVFYYRLYKLAYSSITEVEFWCDLITNKLQGCRDLNGWEALFRIYCNDLYMPNPVKYLFLSFFFFFFLSFFFFFRLCLWSEDSLESETDSSLDLHSRSELQCFKIYTIYVNSKLVFGHIR
jgi:hypothetical protein